MIDRETTQALNTVRQQLAALAERVSNLETAVFQLNKPTPAAGSPSSPRGTAEKKSS